MEKEEKEKYQHALGTYSRGRRKRAIASVEILPIPPNAQRESNMSLCINEEYEAGEYFQNNQTFLQIVEKPMEILKIRKQYIIRANTSGGGLKSQAEAIQLATARRLAEIDSSYRPLLKANGCLTCDSRIKERKKYGLKKSRKASQFSKR